MCEPADDSCRQFNPPGPITEIADKLEALYRREWTRIAAPTMTADERKATITDRNTAMLDDVSGFFRVAVDPIALGIPTYFDVIPPEDARDVGLILRNVKENVYQTVKEVDDAIRLMLENARIFNGEGVVMNAANAFEQWWNRNRVSIE